MGGEPGLWAAALLDPGIRIILTATGDKPQGTFAPIGTFTASTGVTQDKYLLYTPSTQGPIAHYDVTKPIRSFELPSVRGNKK